MSSGMNRAMRRPTLGSKTSKAATRKTANSATIAGDEDLSGTQIATFRLVSRVAIGGSGAIYRAQSPNYPFPLAIKIMHREKIKNRREVAAFRHEFKIGAQLKPPYFLRYVQFGKFESRPYIAMELFTGRPMGALWRNEDATKYFRRKIREFWIAIARAVEALHRAGFVHLDLKPDNFLFDTETGQLKLIDFTLTKKSSSWVRRWLRVRKRAIAGTPTYMSPEQIQRKAPAFTMDLYALGVMLFEYFAGRPPFVGDSQNAVMNQTLQIAPPPLSRFDKRVSKDLDKLVANLLSKDAATRGSAAQLSSALARIVFFTE